MPNSYRVSIRIEPTLNAGPLSSSGYGLVDGLELKQDGMRLLKVRIFQPEGMRGDGIPFISDPITYLDIDVEAISKSHAITNAFSVASRFISLIAYVHQDTFLVTLAGETPIYLLPDMDNLGSNSYVRTASILASFEELELVWNKLNQIEDESIKADLELALDWLHIGFVEQNDKSRFLAYWTCLELLLGPRTSTKVYEKVPEQEQPKLNAELLEILSRYSTYLSIDDQERIIDNIKKTEAESSAVRWSNALKKCGISPLNGRKMEAEMRTLYGIRSAITHSGGKKDSKKLLKEGVPVEKVKHLAMEYIRRLLHANTEVIKTSLQEK